MSEEIMSHINVVKGVIERMILKLRYRAENHDSFKLKEPEYTIFKKYSQRLNCIKFGTPEYFLALKEEEFQVALQHHYKNSPHHPEHWENGINDMSILDIMEMLADWRSSSAKNNGNFYESLAIQKERFGISDQLYQIIINTAKEMDWG